ncbi:MAG: hypothetical protein ACT4OM_10045 [Actinomycetota bacterium]
MSPRPTGMPSGWACRALVVVAIGVVAAAWLPSALFAGYVALVAAGGTATALAHRRPAERAPVALAAAGLPGMAWLSGEAGMLFGMAATFALLSSLSVFRSLRAGSLHRLATSSALVLFAGGLAAYFVLVRDLPFGSRLTVLLFVTVLAFEAGFSIIASRSPKSDARNPWAIASGCLAAAGVAMAAARFLDLGLDAPAAAVAGLVTGPAAWLGHAVPDLALPGTTRVTVRLVALAFSAPAFYYTIRIYLT